MIHRPQGHHTFCPGVHEVKSLAMTEHCFSHGMTLVVQKSQRVKLLKSYLEERQYPQTGWSMSAQTLTPRDKMCQHHVM
jgi:hypothetical protein